MSVRYSFKGPLITVCACFHSLSVVTGAPLLHLRLSAVSQTLKNSQYDSQHKSSTPPALAGALPRLYCARIEIDGNEGLWLLFNLGSSIRSRWLGRNTQTQVPNGADMKPYSFSWTVVRCKDPRPPRLDILQRDAHVSPT